MSKKEKEDIKAAQQAETDNTNSEATDNPNADVADNTAADTPSDEDKIQELGEKLNELNNKYTLLYADFENYRKRTNTEKADLLLNGSREMIKAILPIVDDFERALAIKSDDEGVQLIYNKLIKILSQKGLKAMEAIGQPFDENFHEAVTQVPAPTPEQKNTIIDVVEKGYFFNDKVLRYAKVVVAC